VPTGWGVENDEEDEMLVVRPLGPDEVLSPAASYGSESGEELPMTTEGTFNEALSVTDVILDASRESNEALPPGHTSIIAEVYYARATTPTLLSISIAHN
jgi:hypothetical protein